MKQYMPPLPTCDGTPPRVAYLIGGIARGFEREVMHTSFKLNVMDAFQARSSLFVSLKIISHRSGRGGLGLEPVRLVFPIQNLVALGRCCWYCQRWGDRGP